MKRKFTSDGDMGSKKVVGTGGTVGSGRRGGGVVGNKYMEERNN